MKMIRSLQSCLIIVLLILGCSITAPRAAHADTLSTLAKVIDILPDPFPDKEVITGSGKLISCLANKEGDVGYCVATYGGPIAEEDQYADVVVTVAQIYVAVDNEDVWEIVGLVGHLIGDNAPCIIADLIVPGVGGTLCGAIKEIIEAFASIGEAIVEFFEEIADAVGDLACAIGLGGCDENTPTEQLVYNMIYAPTLGEGLAHKKAGDLKKWLDQLRSQAFHAPPQVNNKAFADFLKMAFPNGFPEDAVDKAESVYTKTVGLLLDNDMVEKVIPALGSARSNFFNNTQEVELIAAQAIAAMKQNYWDVLHLDDKLLETITNKCGSHFYSGGSIEGTNYGLIESWIKSHPELKIPATEKWCSNVFFWDNRLKFSEIIVRDFVSKDFCPSFDKWLLCPNKEKLQSCEQIMIAFDQSIREARQCVNKPPCKPVGETFKCEKGEEFAACVKILGDAKICNGPFQCKSLADYEACLVQGDAKLCSINFDISSAGLEIAKEIDTFFKAQGSKFPCEYGVFDFSKGGTAKQPVQFICSRPTQGIACNSYYSSHYGKIPLKLVNCVVEPSQDYVRLKERVVQVSELLKKGDFDTLHSNSVALKVEPKTTYDKAVPRQAGDSASSGRKISTTKFSGKAAELTCGDWISIPGPDPLIVNGEKCVVDAVKGDSNQNLGFGAPSVKSGFNYDLQGINHIDGASTPVLLEVARPDPQKAKQAAEKSIKEKSMTTEAPGNSLKGNLESGGKPGVNPVNQLSGGKSMVESTFAGGAGGAKLAGTALSGAQTQQQKTMSGSLPPGSTPSVAENPVTVIKAPVQATKPHVFLAALPDITAAEHLRVAGVPVMWSGVVTVDASKAVVKNRNNNGLCEFAVDYGVRNAGSATTASFRSVWTNSAVSGNWPRNWMPVPAGGAKNEKDMLQLKPGSNQLLFSLDDMQQMREANETNNMFSVIINVTGSCSVAAGTGGPSVAPVSPKMPPAPQVQRGAVQLPAAPLNPKIPPAPQLQRNAVQPSRR